MIAQRGSRPHNSPLLPPFAAELMTLFPNPQGGMRRLSMDGTSRSRVTASWLAVRESITRRRDNHHAAAKKKRLVAFLTATPQSEDRNVSHVSI